MKGIRQNYQLKNRLCRMSLAVAVTFVMATAPVFAQTQMIAHGGGAVQGYETTNSVEAVEQAIERGYSLIELDLDLSADGKIIMIHDWDRTAGHYFGRKFEEKLTEEEFAGLLVNGRFEPLTFDKLTEILQAAKDDDVRIITDTKGDNLALLKTLADNYPQWTPYIIPQIYQFDEYASVKALGFSDIILTTYDMEKPDVREVIQFAERKNLYALTVGEWDTKLWKAAADAGLTVFCHPVGTFEKAETLFEKGVSGVYTGTLLPEEFSLPEREHYMMEKDGKTKLTDLWIPALLAELMDLPLAGMQEKQYPIYYLDGERLSEESLTAAADGGHELTVHLYQINEKNVGADTQLRLSYTLWKEEGRLRILDHKYDYRLPAEEERESFEEVMRAADSLEEPIAEECLDILRGSFIAKAGQHDYYSCGQEGEFSVNGELLEAQLTKKGNALIPLTEVLKASGGTARMDAYGYLHFTCGKNRIMSMAETYFVQKNYMSRRVADPIRIYRSRALAAGEVLSLITDRIAIEEEGLLILLPDGIKKVSEEEKGKLFEAAKRLY